MTKKEKKAKKYFDYSVIMSNIKQPKISNEVIGQAAKWIKNNLIYQYEFVTNFVC